MKRIKIWLSLLTIALSVSTFAQSKKFENVGKVNMNGVRAISEQNVVKGYFAFFFLDKEDKKNNNYLLEIMDANLKTTQEISLTKPKTTFLLEGQFNGSHFCFTYLDTKLKSLTSDIYDQSGKKTGSYNITDLDNMAFAGLYSKINSDGYYSGTISPITKKGFILSYTKKSEGQKYEILMFDNAGKKKWTSNSGNSDKSYEILNILNANEKFIVATYSTRPKMMSVKEAVEKSIIINSETGKKFAEMDVKEKDAHLVVHGVDYLSEDEEFVMFGEVFGDKKGGVDLKNKIGFFIRSFNDQGEVISKKTCSWKEDVSKKIDINDKGKFADGVSIMIHKIVKTKDNRYFAIGEQFNKEISAGGLAVKALGGSASAMKIALYNFMTFEFDKDLNLLKVDMILLDKTNIFLPEGYGTVSEDKLGYMLKIYGWFNYNFTTINSDRSNFSAVYTKYNRGASNKDNRYTVGVISLDSDNKLVDKKVELTSKPTAFVSLPTKPGYVAIFEYFKKEKYAEIRLEKLDL